MTDLNYEPTPTWKEIYYLLSKAIAGICKIALAIFVVLNFPDLNVDDKLKCVMLWLLLAEWSK